MPSLTSTTPTTLRDHRDRVARAILDSPHVGLWRPFVATLDADELVAVATRTTVEDLDWERPLSAAARRRLDALAARRLAGEPMALIRGHVEFCGIEIHVRPGVFAPRPSTELLATEALRRLRARRAPVLVDIACGVGPVALTVAHRVRQATTWGLDISADAVAAGRANARRLGLRNARFAVSDLLAALPARLRGGVDVITAHPPYVPRREVRTLPDELRVFEPEHTLTDGSPDGLGMVRRIAEEAPGWLRPGGWVLVEIGPDLARGVAAALRRGGLVEVRSIRDSVGATRVVSGRLPQA